MIQFIVSDSKMGSIYTIKEGVTAYQLISDITQALALAENDGINNITFSVRLSPQNNTVTLQFTGEKKSAK